MVSWTAALLFYDSYWEAVISRNRPAEEEVLAARFYKDWNTASVPTEPPLQLGMFLTSEPNYIVN
ncbi:MAG: hypothetical protein JWQ02_2045 [Capsulimonas sp.]|nr:hypothetical protein [Capsulimonas sp.]